MIYHFTCVTCGVRVTARRRGGVARKWCRGCARVRRAQEAFVRSERIERIPRSDYRA